MVSFVEFIGVIIFIILGLFVLAVSLAFFVCAGYWAFEKIADFFILK